MWHTELIFKHLTLGQLAESAAQAVELFQDEIDLLTIAPQGGQERAEAAIGNRRLYEEDRKRAKMLLEKLPGLADVYLLDLVKCFSATVGTVGTKEGELPASHALEWIASNPDKFLTHWEESHPEAAERVVGINGTVLHENQRRDYKRRDFKKECEGLGIVKGETIKAQVLFDIMCKIAEPNEKPSSFEDFKGSDLEKQARTLASVTGYCRKRPTMQE